MKPSIELANRVVVNNSVKIEYNFASVIVELYDGNIDTVTVVRPLPSGNVVNEMLTNYYLSEYDKASFLSGYEPLALKAFQKYIDYLEHDLTSLKSIVNIE